MNDTPIWPLAEDHLRTMGISYSGFLFAVTPEQRRYWNDVIRPLERRYFVDGERTQVLYEAIMALGETAS